MRYKGIICAHLEVVKAVLLTRRLTSLVGRANVGAPFSLTGPVGWRPGMQCPRSSSFPFSPSSLRHFIAEANQGRADAPPARRL